MQQERIRYQDVIDLGFTERREFDPTYFAEYGFKYCIIELKLTKRIYLDWEKETGFCYMIRVNKEGEIQAKRSINNLEHLKDIVSFFLTKENE